MISWLNALLLFESIKQVGKNRRALVNRYVFSTTGKNAWSKFMDHIAKRYDFSKIRHIYLLADGGNWIKNGLHELNYMLKIGLNSVSVNFI